MKLLKALLIGIIIAGCSSHTNPGADRIRYTVEDMSGEPIQTQPPAQKKIEYTGALGQPVIVRSTSVVWSRTIEPVDKQDVSLTATVVADSLINMRVSIYENGQLQSSKAYETVHSLTVEYLR